MYIQFLASDFEFRNLLPYWMKITYFTVFIFGSEAIIESSDLLLLVDLASYYNYL